MRRTDMETDTGPLLSSACLSPVIHLVRNLKMCKKMSITAKCKKVKNVDFKRFSDPFKIY